MVERCSAGQPGGGCPHVVRGAPGSDALIGVLRLRMRLASESHGGAQDDNWGGVGLAHDQDFADVVAG